MLPYPLWGSQSHIGNLEALPPSGLGLRTVPGSQSILEASKPPGHGQAPELCPQVSSWCPVPGGANQMLSWGAQTGLLRACASESAVGSRAHEEC